MTSDATDLRDRADTSRARFPARRQSDPPEEQGRRLAAGGDRKIRSCPMRIEQKAS